MKTAAPGPGSRPGVGSVAAWQALVLVAVVLPLWLTSLGYMVPSLLFGAGLMLGSLILQRFLASWAFRQRNSGMAVFVLLTKLALVLGLTYFAVVSTRVDPIGFTAGVTTLLVAIVLNVCYFDWSSRRARRAAGE